MPNEQILIQTSADLDYDNDDYQYINFINHLLGKTSITAAR